MRGARAHALGHNPRRCGSAPEEEIAFLQEEIALWLSGIMARKEWKGKGAHEVAASLSGLRISEQMLIAAGAECGLDLSCGLPDGEGMDRVARSLVKMRLPVVVACNKVDAEGGRQGYLALKTKTSLPVFPCSAAGA